MVLKNIYGEMLFRRFYLLSGFFFQVFVFDVRGKTWKSYNWSMVTTLAMFGKYDAELVCYAHSKGARVVLKGTFLPFVFLYFQQFTKHLRVN